MTRTQAVAAAMGTLPVWMMATYLHEARVGTFLRRDVMNRFVYAVVACVRACSLSHGLRPARR